ncbi:MAG: hypothetical protein KDJ41_20285 [Hyphomicrobiaceae bacterium]|nr:hypothetical protein [Hyphomicrobiaceae bacterium]
MLIVHWIGRLLRFLGRLLLRPGVLFAVRMLGGWSFVLAVIALASDIVRSNGGLLGLAPTPFSAHWRAIAPGSYAASEAWVRTTLGAGVWDGPLTALISIPTFVLLAMLGIALYWIGRTRRTVNIYAN